MSLTAVLNATLLDDDVARHRIDHQQKQEQRHLVGKIVEGAPVLEVNKGRILFCSVFVHKLTAPCCYAFSHKPKFGVLTSPPINACWGSHTECDGTCMISTHCRLVEV